jgi:hypothetical protein
MNRVKFTFFSGLPHFPGSRESVVGIATGYGLDDRGVGVQVPVGVRIFTSPRRPDRLWGPPNLLSNGYRGVIPRGLSGLGVNPTIHLQLVPSSTKCGSIYPLPHTPSYLYRISHSPMHATQPASLTVLN